MENKKRIWLLRVFDSEELYNQYHYSYEKTFKTYNELKRYTANSIRPYQLVDFIPLLYDYKPY